MRAQGRASSSWGLSQYEHTARDQSPRTYRSEAKAPLAQGAAITQIEDRLRDLKRHLESRAVSADQLIADASQRIEAMLSQVRIALESSIAPADAVAALEEAAHAVTVQQLDGTITAWNHGAERMYGYPESEALGMDVRRLVPDQRLDELASILERASRGEEIDPFETERVARDGRKLRVVLSVVPLRGRDDRVVALSTVERDAADRRLAGGDRRRVEQKLLESEAKLRAIVQTAVDGILILDHEGKVELVNPAAEAIFGYTGEELLGRPVRDLVHGEEEYNAYLGQYLKTGVKRRIGRRRELRGRRSDGSSFPMELSVSDVTLGNRRLFTIIVRDLSGQKQLEREVLEISAREQQRIGHDLHDGLGQELTGIASLASVLKGELKRKRGCSAEAEEAAEIVRLANRAVAHARSLVRGLCPVRLEEDGLMTALADMAENVEIVHGRTCVFRCEEPVLIHDYDVATHLFYIAGEAVSNALKHGQARRIEINLRVDDGRGLLSVEDDGVGLPAQGPTAEHDGGRGMHIMRYRARLIGGSLYVRNRGGGGTIVACTFDHTNPSLLLRSDHEHRNDNGSDGEDRREASA